MPSEQRRTVLRGVLLTFRAGGLCAAQDAPQRAPRPLTFRSVRPPAGVQSGQQPQADLASSRPTDAAGASESAHSASKPRASTPLPKPNRSQTSHVRPTGGWQALTTVGSSLAVVVGAFLLLVIALRRTQPKGTRPLPPEVLDVLGRKPLTPRTSLQLLRLGRKLVLVAVLPDGIEAVAEVTDPAEVDRLSGLCHQQSSHGISRSFAEILSGGEPVPKPRRGGRRT